MYCLNFNVNVLRVGGRDSRRKVRAKRLGEGSGDVEDVAVVKCNAFLLG
jgi:hypothetical protein